MFVFLMLFVILIGLNVVVDGDNSGWFWVFLSCVGLTMKLSDHLFSRKEINKKISEHIQTLARKKKTLYTQDDYGNIDDSQYVKELMYFTRNVLFRNKSVSKKEEKKWAEYTNKKVKEFLQQQKREKRVTIHEINDTNITSPEQYEDYCANVLKQLGWKARTTRRSGDQGVDVIATKDEITIVLQCKLYSHPVSNKAVQEIIAGKEFFKADYAGVVTNNRYTQSAKELARQSEVLLLNTKDLLDIDDRIL